MRDYRDNSVDQQHPKRAWLAARAVPFCPTFRARGGHTPNLLPCFERRIVKKHGEQVSRLNESSQMSHSVERRDIRIPLLQQWVDVSSRDWSRSESVERRYRPAPLADTREPSADTRTRGYGTTAPRPLHSRGATLSMVHVGHIRPEREEQSRLVG